MKVFAATMSRAGKYISVFCLLVALLCFKMAPVIANATPYVAFDFKTSQGDFGTSIDDTWTSLNFSAGITTINYDVEVTVPYVNRDISGGGFDSSESGIGDVVARGGYRLFSNESNDVSLYGSAAVKFPTADEDKGLGTGETDYGAYLTLSKYWTMTVLSVYSGYRVNGDPPGLDLNNVLSYGVGVSRFFTDNSVYVSLEGRQAIVDGADDPAELIGGMYHRLGQKYFLRGEVSAGLTDGSPDYGLSVGVVRLF
jgi:hypothetical protein